MWKKAPLTPRRVALVSSFMVLALILAMAASLLWGTADISLKQAVAVFSGASEKNAASLILLDIRLPRILLAGLAGFALALGGVVFQAILRNPLADPFILGVSSGSALGAILGIYLQMSFRAGVPLMSFAGALITITLVLLLAGRMEMESSTILLTGVIVNAFFTAVIMFLVSVSTDSRLHTMLFWLYGDLSQSRLGQSAMIAPAVIVVSVMLYAFGKDLNLITVGEETAAQMGVEVERVKMICIVLVSLLMGLVVSFSGLIGFVGLIVPHLARMAFGADHRLLIPVSAVGGAAFLVICDTLARSIASPNELPVGVVTAFMGAPFFVILLRKRGSPWNRS